MGYGTTAWQYGYLLLRRVPRYWGIEILRFGKCVCAHRCWLGQSFADLEGHCDVVSAFSLVGHGTQESIRRPRGGCGSRQRVGCFVVTSPERERASPIYASLLTEALIQLFCCRLFEK